MSELLGLGYSLDEDVYYTEDDFTEALEEHLNWISASEDRDIEDGHIVEALIGDRFNPDIAALVNGADIAERITESPDEIWEINTEDCHWVEELHGSERVHRMIEQAVIQAVRAAIGTPTCWGVKNVRKARIRITNVEKMEWEVIEEGGHE